MGQSPEDQTKTEAIQRMSARKRIALAGTLVVAALLTGCSGSMQAMVRATGEPVNVTFKQGMVSDEITVVMPDGETFKGRVSDVGATSGTYTGFTSTSGYTSTGQATYGSGTTSGVLTTYTGNMQGVLMGDQGHSMRCALRYADPGGLTNLGGHGSCETNDGRVIDISW